MEYTTRQAEIRAAMQRALELASRGPEADPNPRVGCVLLAPDGTTIGEGWHLGAGTDHAEVMALKQAGARAKGATAVVTLEPCNHTGRTGPCAQALLQAGIREVVHAQSDPTAEASGGARTLQRAGVEVSAGLLVDEALELNRTWTFARTNARPWVTWKFAASLDGRSAAADGSSQWITGEPMRGAMNARRAGCGAVVVGTGTVLADDPRLTVRDEHEQPLQNQPLRVVVGDRQVPEQARVRGDDGLFRQLPGGDPAAVLAALQAEGVHHVWLEGGPTLAAAFFQAAMVDEVIACIAPALLGSGTAAVADLGITSMPQIARLRLQELERHGDDIALVLSPTADRPSARPVHKEK